MEEESKKCFVRHQGELWVQARPYQEEALRIFQQEEGDDIRILVPRGEKNPFIAYFSRINENLCRYRTEKGKEVQIVMERPSRIGFINRITAPW
jgi:hypothetical protein